MKNQNITFTAIVLALGTFTFLPQLLAVSPPPDGCYPGLTTAEGCSALFSLTDGQGNTAIGHDTLFSDTGGSWNTAVGAVALGFNNGDFNTAVGLAGLLLNDTGANNTAVGAAAMVSNDTGFDNTAVGAFALLSNTIGPVNSAFGSGALRSNTTGGSNNAFGASALFSSTSGFNNNAFGRQALFNLASGDGNNAFGYFAGASLSAGSGNVYIGEQMVGQSTEDNHTYIRNINTTAVTGMNTDTVTVDLSTGLLGHATSSIRYKQDIKPMEDASERLYRLKPVTYRYKKEIDPGQSLDYGLIAEDVANIDPNLANRNRDGQIESVRYNAINVMLLNEFLKEHKKVQELESSVAQQQKNFESRLAQQEKQTESLSVALQKVSAQLEASRPVPQMAANDR